MYIYIYTELRMYIYNLNINNHNHHGRIMITIMYSNPKTNKLEKSEYKIPGKIPNSK